ncbi:MAG: hypothetical protein IKJ76_01835 [Fibrobacter sp.]|mgnify:CR=1 FL=1|jgi:hypothetical protein|nr:hypothetical protein [Fibrobacter sp.]MBR3850776.1 hypothetical protein [Fibrobacter sp.]
MRADLIDIQIEDFGNDVEISLSGSLSKAQLSAVREKLDSLMSGPGVFFFLNLERAHFAVDDYLEMFLDLMNKTRERNSTMVLLFRNEELLEYFSRYKNIFEIHESREAYKSSGLSKQLKQVGVYYGKKTGLRLSPSVAIAAGVLIMGWLITLFLIIAAQGKDIADKQSQIMALESQRDRYVQEIDKLESSIGPLKRLGVVEDTSQLNSFGAIRDWVSYLKHLENTRREE